jgi:transposase
MRKKIASSDIQRRLMNVYGDKTVDISTVRRWMARFSSDDSDVTDKPRSERSCTALTPRKEERLDQLIRANRRINIKELCTELNIGFNALETMVRAVKQWATSVGADFYERGMQAHVYRWRKCVDNGGDCVEK